MRDRIWYTASIFYAIGGYQYIPFQGWPAVTLLVSWNQKQTKSGNPEKDGLCGGISGFKGELE
jgi:hypothetical protein